MNEQEILIISLFYKLVSLRGSMVGLAGKCAYHYIDQIFMKTQW